MQFAISIPQFFADGTFDPAGLRAYLTRAEALGFDSAWTGERLPRSRAHVRPPGYNPSLAPRVPISEPLPVAEPRLGRRTVLTLPLLPPPQKN